MYYLFDLHYLFSAVLPKGRPSSHEGPCVCGRLVSCFMIQSGEGAAERTWKDSHRIHREENWGLTLQGCRAKGRPQKSWEENYKQRFSFLREKSLCGTVV